METRNSGLDPHAEMQAAPPLCQTLAKSCPECGCSMTEVDRRQENGTLYVWMECVESSCAYQWLDHFPCW